MTRHSDIPAALTAACVLVFVVLATPRSGPWLPPTVTALSGAPHDRGALEPGDGNQLASSSEGPVARLPRPAVAPQPTGAIGTVLTGTPSDVTWQGTISYVGASYGRLYLALPQPRGTWATICGPAACVTRLSTDFGPDQRVWPDRIADVSAWDFERICGVPLSFGLCPGSVTIQAAPPATDTKEGR